MIGEKNIRKLFFQIDKALEKRGEKRNFIIFGSGALIMSGLCQPDRSTMDVDLIEPKIDPRKQHVC